MRREARAGHAQAARMGEAGLELQAAHALGVGHAQGTADQQAQRAHRAAQHEVPALAAKQRVAGEADAQAKVAGTMARVGMRLALAGEAQFISSTTPGMPRCSPLPPQPLQGPVLR